ncbi:hypothetical protein [Nocardia crassostreae]|uniref:hypothetical protein n=1 Tax=Nocardia crassostreae TaxID=53428 RepID=UPI00082C32BF|nr:hypothetical protein [Nocardia crassostreae]
MLERLPDQFREPEVCVGSNAALQIRAYVADLDTWLCEAGFRRTSAQTVMDALGLSVADWYRIVMSGGDR